MNILSIQRLALAAFLGSLACVPVVARAQAGDAATVSGLVIPRDDDGMYVRNPDGQFEIEWTAKTQFALDVNTRLLAGLKNGSLNFKVHSSNQIIRYPLPQGPVTAIIEVRGGKQLATSLKEANDDKWISERGLTLYFGEKPKGEQLPTEG
ncbi:MAG: hypothetical protein N2C14_32680, partial [Planctomycetales bacterium]